MIDTAALRQLLQDAGPGPADDVVTGATRGFIEQLLGEIEEGRLAKTALAMHVGMQAVIDTITTPRGRPA